MDKDQDAYEAEWGNDTQAVAVQKAEDDPFEFDRGEGVKPLAEAESKTEAPKAASFKETFAAQRKAGAKTFEWNGKKYTTNLKGEAKAEPSEAATPAPVAAPAPKAEPVAAKPVRGGSYAKGSRSDKKFAVDAAPAYKKAPATKEEYEADYVARGGKLPEKKVATVRTSSPMRG